MKLKIDPEFRDLIPPLTQEEYNQLEINIITEGCRDALVTWNGTIIDGHNRYKICTEHNIPFETANASFDNREEAINWIIDNQLGRRNITSNQKSYLLGLRYRQEKKSVGEHTGNQYSKLESGKMYHIPKTSQQIADQHGVSEKTIRNAEVFADGLDRLDSMEPGIKREILQGKVKITKGEVMELGKATDERFDEIKKGVTSGKVVIEKGFITPKKIEKKVEEETGTYICKVCGKEKSITDFYNNNKSTCKKCSSESARGLGVEGFKSVSEWFDGKANDFYEQMKSPSADTDEPKTLDTSDPIITDLTQILKSFDANITKYIYMSEKEVCPEVTETINRIIENLKKINSKLKEI